MLIRIHFILAICLLSFPNQLDLEIISAVCQKETVTGNLCGDYWLTCIYSSNQFGNMVEDIYDWARSG